MLHFLLRSTVLADAITIKIGNNAWTIGTSFIVYLIVAAIVGLVAEVIVGWRLPFGFVGAIIAGFLRIVVPLRDLPQWIFLGIAYVAIVVSVWALRDYWTGPAYEFMGLIAKAILIATQ